MNANPTAVRFLRPSRVGVHRLSPAFVSATPFLFATALRRAETCYTSLLFFSLTLPAALAVSRRVSNKFGCSRQQTAHSPTRRLRIARRALTVPAGFNNHFVPLCAASRLPDGGGGGDDSATSLLIDTSASSNFGRSRAVYSRNCFIDNSTLLSRLLHFPRVHPRLRWSVSPRHKNFPAAYRPHFFSPLSRSLLPATPVGISPARAGPSFLPQQWAGL